MCNQRVDTKLAAKRQTFTSTGATEPKPLCIQRLTQGHAIPAWFRSTSKLVALRINAQWVRCTMVFSWQGRSPAI